jgi:predicted RNA-binding Zn ribbon-like protein
MGKLARQFKVPDSLANLYEFANSLDLRTFTHKGVPHANSDDLRDAKSLASWMMERGLIESGTAVPASAFTAAIRLRSNIRELIGCDPARRKGSDVSRALNESLQHFALIAQANGKGEMQLQSLRSDALGGLASIVAELYDASREGCLDRLKMCAAEECRRVFFDKSKPGSRRWCMSTLCGNRMKTRAYRERHKS